MAAPSWARQTCEEIAVNESIWSSTTLPEGITLSLDSEIPTGQAINFIRQDQDLNEKLGRALTRLPIVAEDLAAYMGMSPKQFRSFGLRPGVNKTLAAYTLNDWNSIVWNRVIHDWQNEDRTFLYAGKPSRRFRDNNLFNAIFTSTRKFYFGSGFGFRVVKKIHPLFKERFDRLRLPLVAETDAPDLEVKWDGFTVNPREFKATVESVHKLFSHAQTHLHFGLVSSLYSEDVVIKVTRAMETVVILEGALYPQGSEPRRRGYSSLVNEPDDNKGLARGAVGFIRDRFYEPVRAHDIQFREYTSLGRGLDLLEMGVALAANKNRLKNLHADFTGVDTWNDPVTYNLQGALLYAAAAFEKSTRHDDQQVGQKLLMFAGEIANLDGIIKDELRVRLAEYLASIDIVARLNVDLFLEAEIQN